MKDTPLTKMVDQVIALKLRAVDAWIEENVEALLITENPEHLLGKPYEEWTPQELQALGRVYGPEPNALSKLIARKEEEKLKALQAEVRRLERKIG